MLKKLPLFLLLLALFLTFGLFAVLEKTPLAAEKQPAHGEAATERAIFAGGCFWCMESPFEEIPGVIEVLSGYTGGEKLDPTYKEVSAGGTGHTEAVEVLYDPKQVSYSELLDVFWMQINPTDAGGQFVDRGTQYRSGIYQLNSEQQRLAEASKQLLAQSGRFAKPVITEIVAAGKFYPAEEYHQDYYKKNPIRYKYYRYGSGRDKFLDQVWGTDRH
jgi:methionine-S-sulfoxide reductase